MLSVSKNSQIDSVLLAKPLLSYINLRKQDNWLIYVTCFIIIYWLRRQDEQKRSVCWCIWSCYRQFLVFD